MAFVPSIAAWRWYANDGAEPSSALAAENTAPTLAAGTLGTNIRLRVAIENSTPGESFNGTVSLAVGTSAPPTVEVDGSTWDYGNGAATDGDTIASNKFTLTDSAGRYHENATGTEFWTAYPGLDPSLTDREMDFTVFPVNGGVAASTLYYFAVVFHDGSDIPIYTNNALGTGYPSITSPPAAGADGTATPSGVSATASVGTASGLGGGTASPAGLLLTSAVGTAVAFVGALPDGVEVVAEVGTAVAVGDATAAPDGVECLSAVGSVLAGVLSTATPDGVAATASVGTPTASGGATAAPGGLYGGTYLGAVVAVGNAVATCLLDGLTALVGTPRVLATTPSSGTAATLSRPLLGSAVLSNARRPRG